MNNGVVVNLGSISVNTMDTNTGLFVGSNVANGWSSHSKTNEGLGSVREGSVSHSLNIVLDNDLIDAPIDDRDILISAESGNQLESLSVNFDSIEANALGTNSTISVGHNSQSGWDAHAKSNLGCGKLNGNSILHVNENVVVDDDIIDSPINDQDYKPSFASQAD